MLCNAHLMYPLMIYQMPSGSGPHSLQSLFQLEF